MVDKGETNRLFPPPSLPCSSVVEQVTVNHLVAGSNPAGAAIKTFNRPDSGRLFYVRTTPQLDPDNAPTG